jgi:hypothetical protein
MNIRAKIYGAQPGREDTIHPSKKARRPKAESLDRLISREEARTNHTRSEDRHRLLNETVVLEHGDQSHEVQLINVSGGGAMVSGDVGLGLWDHVELHLGEHGLVECVVRWLRDDRFGLEFAHETRIDCGEDEQAAVLREVVRRSFPDVHFEADDRPGHSDPDVRGDRRHPLVWLGVIHHDFESTPVRLRNVSTTGAMIECAAALAVGSEPLLEIGNDVTITTKVAWVLGDQAGLRFTSPFDLQDLARSKPEVAAPRWTPPAFLDTGSASDSPWSDHWDRMSVYELREELEGFLKR